MEIILRETRYETPTVFSLFFDKPAGFDFKAGQFLRWEFPVDPCDERCNKRSFSIASSPTENYLMLTTRYGESALKKALPSLQPGTNVKVIGPMGRFTVDETSTQPIVFLTGGVGITPIRSMIKYLLEKHLLNPLTPLIPLTLLYSNKTQAEIVYRKELADWQTNFANFKLVETITALETSKEIWTGRVGRINADLIKDFIPNLNDVRFYISGLPDMVKAMQHLLTNLTVPIERIHSEQFSGY